MRFLEIKAEIIRVKRAGSILVPANTLGTLKKQQSSTKEWCHLSSIRHPLGGNSHHRRAAEYILGHKESIGKELKWSKTVLLGSYGCIAVFTWSVTLHLNSMF